MRSSLAERVILAAARDKLASDERLAYVLERVKAEIGEELDQVPEATFFLLELGLLPSANLSRLN